MGLLVLFDGSAALRQPPALELEPRAPDDSAHAGWAESEGLPAVVVLLVRPPEREFNLGPETQAALPAL